jgi:C4-type Zn-finger protein
MVPLNSLVGKKLQSELSNDDLSKIPSYGIECPHCSAKITSYKIPYENQVIVCPECQKRSAVRL